MGSFVLPRMAVSGCLTVYISRYLSYVHSRESTWTILRTRLIKKRRIWLSWKTCTTFINDEENGCRMVGNWIHKRLHG